LTLRFGTDVGVGRVFDGGDAAGAADNDSAYAGHGDSVRARLVVFATVTVYKRRPPAATAVGAARVAVRPAHPAGADDAGEREVAGGPATK
jgi:hypothetical protein